MGFRDFIAAQRHFEKIYWHMAWDFFKHYLFAELGIAIVASVVTSMMTSSPISGVAIFNGIFAAILTLCIVFLAILIYHAILSPYRAK